ncbi:MAG: AraC family transcriptional regulator [Crocinitomicaceae bacterium]|nr:AraC family transcriptional regulator [Crocinitomicaceae bacterium]
MIEKILNIAESSEQLSPLDKGLILLNVNQLESHTNFIWDELTQEYIQFHFGLKGTTKVHFNQKQYTIDLQEEQSLLIYNPNQKLPLDMDVQKDSSVISLFVKIELFHSFFSEVADHIPFLNEEHRNKKYYDQSPITPETILVLNQINKLKFQDHLQQLYLKGKAYELISVYFNQSAEAAKSCPFLMDDEYLSKIKQVKDIVVENMINPPTLTELSEDVGLNLKKLKQGFKQVYGSSVFNFLFDYKMEFSRKLLDSGKYNINEVGEKVGYSTASHFISSFKKKYGITPKKYVLSQNRIR